MKIERFNEIIKYIANVISGSLLDGHVYVVGGCVRDYVMGNEIKDIDIAVDFPDGGKMLGDLFDYKGLLLQPCVNFPAYSVCKFVLKQYPDVELEAVQTRKEKYTDTESRNPVTAFGSIEEDCYRRDLTINSLYMNVSNSEILDLTGNGLADIKRGLCRTPLDPVETFDDDPLRMLRVGRFMSRFNFQVAYETYTGIREKKDRLKIISVERVNDELCKMLADKSAGVACTFLKETGLLSVLFPDMDFNVLSIRNVFYGMFILHKYGHLAKLAFMLLNVCKKDKDSALNFLQTLKFSNADIKQVMKIFETVNRLQDIAEKHNVDSHILYKECWLAGSYDYLEMCLSILYCLGGYDNKYLIGFMQTTAIDCIFERGTENFFEFEVPMNGDEIMKEFNLKPGPEIKIVQEWMMDWIFRHPLFEKEDLIKYIHDCI